MANISGSTYFSSTLTDTLPKGADRPKAVRFPARASKRNSYRTGTTTGRASRLYYRKWAMDSPGVGIHIPSRVCVDGLVGFSHVREMVIFNEGRFVSVNEDGTQWVTDTSDEADVMTVFKEPAWAPTFSGGIWGGRSFNHHLAGGTDVGVAIPPGSYYVVPPRPLGTTGYVVDATHDMLWLAHRPYVLDNEDLVYTIIILGD